MPKRFAISLLRSAGISSLMCFSATLLLISGCSKYGNSFMSLGELQFEKTVAGQSRVVNSMDLGKVIFGTVSKQTFSVRNRGDVAVRIVSFRLNPPSLAEHLQFAQNCPEFIEPNADPCLFDITITPKTIADLEGSLILNYDDGKGGAFDAELKLRAAVRNVAYLTFDPEMTTVGPARINASSTAVIRLRYNGSLAAPGITIKKATDVNFSNPSDSQFSIVGTDCFSLVTPGPYTIDRDCSVTVRFAPNAEKFSTGDFLLNYFNGSESAKARAYVQAEGQSILHIPRLTRLTDAAVDFGNVFLGISKNIDVPVYFRSAADLNITANVAAEHITITGPSSNQGFSIDPGPETTCQPDTNQSLGPMVSCNLRLRFSPTGASGDGFTDSITIQYDSSWGATPAAPLTIPVRGNAKTPPKLTVNSITPSSADFGNISLGLSAISTMSIVLKNSSMGFSIPVIPQAFSISLQGSHAAAFSIVSTTCGAELAPQATCNVTVSFRPIAAGIHSGALHVGYDNRAGGDTLDVPLSGAGSNLATISPASAIVDFGTIYSGDSATVTKLVSVQVSGKSTWVPNFSNLPAFITVDPSNCGAAPTSPPASCTLKFTLNPALLTDPAPLASSAWSGSSQMTFSNALNPADQVIFTFSGTTKSRKVNMTPATAAVDFGTFFAGDGTPISKTIAMTVYGKSSWVPSFTALPQGVTVDASACGIAPINPPTNCDIVFTLNPAVLADPAPSLTTAFSSSTQMTFTNALSASEKVVFNFTGTIKTAKISITPATANVNFGAVHAGDIGIVSRTITLSASGRSNWVPSFGALPTGVTVDTSNCGSAPIAQPTTCNVVFNLDPSLLPDPTPAATSLIGGSSDMTFTNAVAPGDKLTFTFSGTIKTRKVTMTAATTTVNFGTVYAGDVGTVSRTVALSVSGKSPWVPSFTALPAGISVNATACGPAPTNPPENCNVMFTLDPSVLADPAPVATSSIAGSTNMTFTNALNPADKITFNFSGTVRTRKVTITPATATVAFGTVYAGDVATVSKTVTVSVSGKMNWVPSFSALPAGVSVDSSACGTAPTSPPTNCNIVFTLNPLTLPDPTPLSSSTLSGSSDMTFTNALNAADKVRFTFSGTIKTRYLTITPALNVIDFGTFYAGDATTVSKTLTLTVNGKSSWVPTWSALPSGVTIDASTCGTAPTAPPQTCTVTFKLTPTGVADPAPSLTAPFAGSSEMTFTNALVPADKIAVTFSGSVKTRKVSMTPASATVDFGTFYSGDSTTITKVLTLTISGKSAWTPTWSVLPAGVSILSNTCGGAPTAPPQSCTFTFKMTPSLVADPSPSSTGAFSGSSDLTFSNAANPADKVTVNFTGIVKTRFVTITPATVTVDFGSFFANDSATISKTATITVNGKSSWTPAFDSLPAGISVNASGCGSAPITPPAACNIVFTLDPSALADPAPLSSMLFSATTQMTFSNALTAGDKVIFSFTGTAKTRKISIVPASTSIDFGTVYAGDSASVTRSVALNVFGKLPYASAFTSAFPAIQLDASACGTAPSTQPTTCVLVFTLNPQLLTDPAPLSSSTVNTSSDFTFDNAQSNPKITFSFTLAVKSPKVSVTPAPANVDFGAFHAGDSSPGATISRTATFTTTGKLGWAPQIAGLPSEITVSANTCGVPGQTTCSITFILDPKFVQDPSPATSASYAKNASLTYTNPLNPASNQIVLNFSGTVQTSAAAIAVTAITPRAVVGSSVDFDVIVKNESTGILPATISALPSMSSDGEFQPRTVQPGTTGICSVGTVLPVGSECKIPVRFAPITGGLRTSGLLSLQYLDVGLGKAASFQLSGAGVQRIRLFASSYNTCMINELGQLVCWGRNNAGQLGQGARLIDSTRVGTIPPIDFPAGSEVQDVAIGDSHICAILSGGGIGAGTVTCWGNNQDGRLGLGISPATLPSTNSPLGADSSLRTVNLGTSASAVALSAGVKHTCALLADGRVKCWGGNASAQLGNGSMTPAGSTAASMGDNLLAVNLLGVKAVGISSGAGHSCAILQGGGVKCWGDNFYGQLGQGSDLDNIPSAQKGLESLAPIDLGAGVTARSVIATPSATTCILTTTGKVKCFGKTFEGNDVATATFFGVLGNCWARDPFTLTAGLCEANPAHPHAPALGNSPSDMGNQLPALDFGGLTASAIKGGSSFFCAVLSDKSIRCWGMGDQGQLGNGTTVNVGQHAGEMGANLRPVSLSSFNSDPVEVALGQEHGCAVLNDNRLVCWGSAVNYAAGLAETSLVPVVVYSGN